VTYRLPSWRTLALVTAVALLASAVLVFSRPAVMIVDGERVESEVAPIATTSEKVFVPLRTMADALGAETKVEDGYVVVVRGNQALRLRVGDTHATLNGVPFSLKHPPFRVRRRLMVGLNVLARAFNVRATYDPATARIEVLTPGVGQVPEPYPADQTQ